MIKLQAMKLKKNPSQYKLLHLHQERYALMCLNTLNTEHGLFIKHEFKPTGYWLSFFCVCVLDQDGIKVHKLANKNKPNIQSS